MQVSDADLWTRLESFHQKARKMSFHRASKKLADERQSAAQNDHLRMRQVHYMRKDEREVLRGFVQNSLGERVATLNRLRQMTRLGAVAGADKTRKH